MKRSPPHAVPSTFVFVVLLVFATTGCGGAPVYRLHTGRVHKDLIVCNVHLATALDAEEYARIARLELDNLLKSPVATPDGDLPLYEVRFEFLLTDHGDDSFHKVATVQFSLLAPESPPRITLYPVLF